MTQAHMSLAARKALGDGVNAGARMRGRTKRKSLAGATRKAVTTAKAKSVAGRLRLLGAEREDRCAGLARLMTGAKAGTQGPPRDAVNRHLGALRA